MNFLNLFSKIYKGNEGEVEVVNSITKLLNAQHNGEENYYLIPKATLSDTTASREIDILLLHPIFGIYAIEVKNWDSLDYINAQNDPFAQANEYQDLLMSLLKDEFGNIPVNVEYRVIFPSISQQEAESFFEQNPYYKNFKNHTFFQEHLHNKDIFLHFFNSSNTTIPNKKTFLKIASLLVPTQKLKQNQEKIIPIITKDEIVFFDQKQLSILNGYTGGFRIIRGVAGTGKTVILTNFVHNRLQQDENEKFLILCFNRNLVEATKNSFGEKFQKRNIAVLSMRELLDRINFDFERVGITKETTLEQQYDIFETDEALEEFKKKFSARVKQKPIDYFLCDETQDMPAGFLRIIYETIQDCIFFIDEAQKFYPYTMGSIAEVFHHPKFEKLSMRGRVKNLKNVYRTPSNIAKAAFEILAFDRSLNDYYKRSYYLKNDFLTDVNLVLEDGVISLGKWDDFVALKKLLLTLPKDKENVVLAYTRKSLLAIEEIIKSINAQEYIKVMTMQSVKGLEAQNIIIHNFGTFIINAIKHKNPIFYRQLYVLLTRAQENIYLSIDTIDEELEEMRTIYKILKKYENQKLLETDRNKEQEQNKISSSMKLAKLKPIIEDTKTGVEFIVSASELFGIIGGLFSMV